MSSINSCRLSLPFLSAAYRLINSYCETDINTAAAARGVVTVVDS